MKNTAKRKTPSRKKDSSAAAVKPLITKLYEGTADLIIKVPQKPKKNTGKVTPDTEEPAKELIEITLPPISKTAEDSDRVAALASALISYLTDYQINNHKSSPQRGKTQPQRLN